MGQGGISLGGAPGTPSSNSSGPDTCPPPSGIRCCHSELGSSHQAVPTLSGGHSGACEAHRGSSSQAPASENER